MSQRAQVGTLLREKGTKGVHTFELRRAYIANPSERIRELEERGWVIHHTREKLNGDAWGTRYRLISEPDAGRGALPTVDDVAEGRFPPESQSAPSSSGQLFEVEAPKPKPHWEAV